MKILLILIPFLNSCNLDLKKIEKKSALINNYEKVSLHLAKENRKLQVHIKQLEYEISKLKSEKPHTSKAVHRDVASVAHESDSHLDDNHLEKSHDVEKSHVVKNDLVLFETYKWSEADILKIALTEYGLKNFERSAQFFQALKDNYNHSKKLDENFYFKAGLAAYESKNHYDWSIENFENLIKKYPTSSYYRSSKLFLGMTHLKLGKKDAFFAVVEEFRKKYRNTKEWDVLSSYYESIEEKTKGGVSHE